MLLCRFIVIGHSMEPTLHNGSIVLGSSIPYFFFSPKTGDMAIIKDQKSGKILIKRIREKKANKYYLIGDNATDSLDSRSFGWVEKKDIMGKVIWF